MSNEPPFNKHSLHEAFLVIAGTFGIAIVGAPMLALFGASAVEVMTWLETGEWANLRLASFAPAPEIDGIGANQLLQWAWNLWIGIPLALAAFLLWGIVRTLVGIRDY